MKNLYKNYIWSFFSALAWVILVVIAFAYTHRDIVGLCTNNLSEVKSYVPFCADMYPYYDAFGYFIWTSSCFYLVGALYVLYIRSNKLTMYWFLLSVIFYVTIIFEAIQNIQQIPLVPLYGVPFLFVTVVAGLITSMYIKPRRVSSVVIGCVLLVPITLFLFFTLSFSSFPMMG